MFDFLKKKLQGVTKKLTKTIKEKKVVKKVVRKVVEKKLSEKDVEPILNELEIGLIESDVAYDVAEKIKNDLKKSLVGTRIRRGKEREVVVEALRKSLLEILNVPEINLIKKIREHKKMGMPYVLLFLGFNGSGKTTTIAKIANWLKKKKFSCVFAAADTFRAASIEQLEEHGKNLGVNVIKHKYGADPAAVVYDAKNFAKSKNLDVVLVDTAGRTHTNKNLMEELRKICKVNNPDLKILVLDSLVGNDAVLQAKMFDEAVGVDAVFFSKVDVNEKGGAILSVTHAIKKPVLFLGVGQSVNDIKPFSKEGFVERLLK
jgi:fused signal recognition particle receptor